jgi:hypothetical protein
MKKLHQILLLTILLVLPSSKLFSQDSQVGKQKELYLSNSLFNISSFGLQYKSEIKNQKYFRLGFTGISSDFSRQTYGTPVPEWPSIYSNIEGTFDIGFEKRSHITDKLSAYCGINFVTSGNFRRRRTEDPSKSDKLRNLDFLSINPGLGFNSGFLYKVNDAFSISAEVIPRLLYNYTVTQRITGLNKVNDINQGGSFEFNTHSVLVSFIYNWSKP